MGARKATSWKWGTTRVSSQEKASQKWRKVKNTNEDKFIIMEVKLPNRRNKNEDLSYILTNLKPLKKAPPVLEIEELNT